VGMGKAALVGIVSAEAVALMKGVSQTMTTTKLLTLTAAVLSAGLFVTGVGLMASPGQQPGGQAAIAKSKGQPSKAQEDPSPLDAGAGQKALDDRLDALLRLYEDGLESNRRAAKDQLSAAEKKARYQANAAKLQGIDGQLLDLAARHPRTNAAEQALIEIIAHVPFSPESRRAWELLARDGARSDRIKPLLSRQLELHWASRAVEDLLHNASEQNPYREIRGLACYWLAEILKYRAEILRIRPLQPPALERVWRQRFSPQDLERVAQQDPRSLEDEAARLYERVIAEFPLVANNDSRTAPIPLILGRTAPHLPAVAQIHLDELRRLSAGRPAPEIEGMDLDGKPMKLSDFRGKVVVLEIAGFGVQLARAPDQAASQRIESFRRLASTIEGKPVALLGVVEAHREEYQKAIRASGLPIRFWWDPEREGQPELAGKVWSRRPGPIHAAWDAEGPNIYVIDAKGVIRYTHAFGLGVVEKAVAAVLKEQGSGPEQAKKNSG
jgi:peroxiredoxin